jgi:DNA-binding Lrp family transcriptional regulator
LVIFLPLAFTVHRARKAAADSHLAARQPDLDIDSLRSVKTGHLDDVDRQLIHALMVAPRASFRVLAGVLDVSDQTVARRYRGLAERVGLHVFGLIDGPRAGWADWIVRLQAAPGSAQRIAETLAQRPDTRWVKLYSGGTEIVCAVQARTAEQRNALFLRGLPGSRHVTAITAQSIINIFTPVAFAGYANALSPSQLAALREAAPEPAAEPGSQVARLRSEDDPLLAELGRDGRAPIADLAAATHWHESTVRRRMDELRRAGLLYFDVDIDVTMLGVNSNVMLWLKIETASLDAAGRMVATHPEVPFAAATTGPTNLAVSALFRDTRELYRYLTTRLAGLPGLRSVETAPIISTIKRVGKPAAASLPRRPVGANQRHEHVVDNGGDPRCRHRLEGHQQIVPHQVERQRKHRGGQPLQVDLAALACSPVDVGGPRRPVAGELGPHLHRGEPA